MLRTDRDAAPAVAVLWSLNGLRAVGALMVMLYHVNSWNLQVLRGSSAFYTGVGLFFVLSGFVLTWTARPGVTVGAFYTRRVARILPNHLVAFALGAVVTVAVVGTTIDPVALLAGTFLLQAWLPDDQSVFAVNGVAWSLSCEIAFYAVFPALFWGLRRLRARGRAAVALTAIAVPPVLGLIWPGLITLMFHLPPARLPEFVLGMVTAMAVQDGWRPRVPAPALLGVLAVLIVGAARFDVHPTVLTAVLALVFAPLAARCAWSDVDGRSGWARHPAVMLGGALSFSFYLVHELVIKVLVATPLRGWVTIPVVLVASAVLALALWRGVELPARARILAATHQPGPRLVTGRTTGSRRPPHSRPLSVAWSFPAVPAGSRVTTWGPVDAVAVALPTDAHPTHARVAEPRAAGVPVDAERALHRAPTRPAPTPAAPAHPEPTYAAPAHPVPVTVGGPESWAPRHPVTPRGGTAPGGWSPPRPPAVRRPT